MLASSSGIRSRLLGSVLTSGSRSRPISGDFVMLEFGGSLSVARGVLTSYFRPLPINGECVGAKSPPTVSELIRNACLLHGRMWRRDSGYEPKQRAMGRLYGHG